MSRKLIGRYIVADPEICHGKPTFRGTRILVADVLHDVAAGREWDKISAVWGGKVSKEAIAESVSLASQVFLENVQDYVVETASA